MATPSHVDLSVLWVPIMPETSKLGSEMEKAGKDATESFGKGSSKLGDKIVDTVSKSNDKIKETFGKTGSDAAQTMADSFKEKSKNIDDAVTETGRRTGSKLDSLAASWGKSIGAKLGDSLHGGFDKIDEYAQKIGVDISGWTGPIKDTVGPLTDLKTNADGFRGQIKDVVRDFENMPGKIGKVGSAIGELAGPIAVVAAAWAAAFKERPWDSGPDWNKRPDGSVDPWKLAAGPVGTWLEDKYNRFRGNIPHTDSGHDSGPTDYSDMLLGPGGSSDQASSNFTRGGDPKRWGGTLGSSQDAYDLFSSGQPLPQPDTGKDSTPRESSRGSSQGTKPSYNTSAITGGVSTPRDLHTAGSRIANLYALANALQGTPYSQSLRNDCSGMVSRLATVAVGMEPSVQFTTVNEGDWLMSHGFQPGYGPPGSLRVGWNPQPGNAGHTAATLPGGEHAESGGAHGNFLVGAGAAGADDPQFSMHAWLPMGRSTSGKMSPLGSKDDPLFTTAVSQDGSSDQDDPSQKFGQGFLDGIAQSVGLDGSVFKGFGGASNPKDFGITKLGMGLLNWGLGQQHSMPGARGSIPQGPGGAQNVRTDQTGDTHNYYGPVSTGMNVTQHGVTSPTGSLNDMNNSSRTGTATMPNAGTLPSG